ncbi:MAG: tRNA epoxyqueuosine(34) reductase QueG [Ignavibacteriales bacterium]|nr:tRNA epoxyqueuosine(34) reductase QueG [Ignavibacteriales bacterium]
MKATLTEEIKQKALEMGFVRVGVARSEHLSGESLHLTEWLRRGYHGTMDWMERNGEKRADPAKIVPNARSVVAVAMNYYTDFRHREDPEIGKISRYAWGDDYHQFMGERLERLAEFMSEKAPQSHNKAYVDTGPVMDKVWAARAGLGWQGKHTNLITKDYGSWVFLGEVITDLELQADEPIADFCGTCTACIEACPTGAIVEPYRLDATRCISYLTIEHKGDIPEEIHPDLQNWIYGCDICQDVCPWNSFQQPTSEAAFFPRSENETPKLAELVDMTHEEFTARYRKSPIKRTKLEGLRRNAKAAIHGKKEKIAK